ncbi:DUF6069 family protein [Streptomyces sp. NPDC093546]|uniref:DUF6069 family protein n=1 Tax=Streptomyces sp. NPDC093546 TaxID=3366040 RepID=UPI00380D7DBA
MSSTSAQPRIWQSGMLFGVIAVAANLVVFGIARVSSGGDLVVPGWNGNPPQTVGPVPILFMTLVPAVLAVLFGLALKRFLRAPRTAFLAVVGGLTLLSCAGPLTSGAGGGTVAALTAMHLLTGGLIGYGVSRALPTADRRATQTTPA